MGKRHGRHNNLKLILFRLNTRDLVRGEWQIFLFILLCLYWEWQISFNSPSSTLGSGCLKSCVDKDCEAIRRYNRKVINLYQINYQNQSRVRRGEQLHF